MITRESIAGAFPVRPLAEVAEFLDSRRKPVKEADRNPGPYPYYGANGQQGSIDGYLFDEPLILLAEDGGFFDQPDRGIAYRISGKTWVNNHAHVIRPREGMDLAFLCRVLENYNVLPYISGSTRAKLTKGQAEKIEIPLPPLAEQKRIAAILDQADDLRRKRQHSLDRLSALGQAIFHDMFGDSTSASGWRFPCQRLEAVCRKVTDGTHQAPKWADSGIPFVFVSNVRDHRIDLETKKYVSREEFEKLTKSARIERGDVLYTCVGSYGHTALVDGSADFIFQRHIAHIKPSSDLISSQFLVWCLESPKVRDQADRTCTGIAQKTVTLKALKAFEIPVPDRNLQCLFEERIEVVERQRKMQEYWLQEASALFQSLQHRAFRGEL